MTNRRSVADFLQGIPFFVRSANIDIILLILLAERILLRFAYPKCYHILTILPLRSAMPIQDMNIPSAIISGRNNTSAPIYWRGLRWTVLPRFAFMSRQCLFRKLQQAEKEILSFTEKRHVQILKNPRSPQCRTEADLLPPSRALSFFVTIYL